MSASRPTVSPPPLPRGSDEAALPRAEAIEASSRPVTASHLRLLPTVETSVDEERAAALTKLGLSALEVISRSEPCIEFAARRSDGERVRVVVATESAVTTDGVATAMRVASRLLGASGERLEAEHRLPSGESVWIGAGMGPPVVGVAASELPLRTVLPLVARAARLLAVVHAAGLAHGRLRPAHLRAATSRRQGMVLTGFGESCLVANDLGHDVAGGYAPIGRDNKRNGSGARGDCEALLRIVYHWLAGVEPRAGEPCDLDRVVGEGRRVLEALQSALDADDSTQPATAIERHCRELMRQHGIRFDNADLPSPRSSTLWRSPQVEVVTCSPWLRPMAAGSVLVLLAIGTAALRSVDWRVSPEAQPAQSSPTVTIVAPPVPVDPDVDPNAATEPVSAHDAQRVEIATARAPAGRDASASPVVDIDAEELELEVEAERSSAAGSSRPRSPTHDPDRANQLAKRGNAALRAGDRDTAAKLFAQALAADPRNVAALSGSADVHFDRGRYAQARSFAERAVRIAPRRAGLRMRLGDAYFKVLRYADAKAQYERAAALGHKDAARRIDKIERLLGQ